MMFPLLVFKDVSSGISTVGVQWRFCCWSSIIHKLSLCIIIEVTYKFVPRVILLKFTCIFTPKSPNKYISICSPLRSLLWNNSGIGIVFKYKRNLYKIQTREFLIIFLNKGYWYKYMAAHDCKWPKLLTRKLQELHRNSNAPDSKILFLDFVVGLKIYNSDKPWIIISDMNNSPDFRTKESVYYCI